VKNKPEMIRKGCFLSECMNDNFYTYPCKKLPNGLRKPRMLLRGTGAGAGVDSAWEQKKLETTLHKMLTVGAVESLASSSRFVGAL